jgi:hypothetical protein
VTGDELATQDEDDLQWVASTPQGRRFLARMIYRWGHLEEQSEKGEERSTSFNEGQRCLAIHLKSALDKASPRNHDLMVLEHIEERRAHRVQAPADSSA